MNLQLSIEQSSRILGAAQNKSYDAAFGKFFKQLNDIGINETNTLFIITADEGDEGAGEDEFGPQQIADWRPNPEQLYSRVELLNILRKAVESLPLAYSTVFWLRTEGFSIIETAEMLGITEPAVKTRLLRARLQVRQRLSLYFEGEETSGIAASQIAEPVRSSRNGTATYLFIP